MIRTLRAAACLGFQPEIPGWPSSAARAFQWLQPDAAAQLHAPRPIPCSPCRHHTSRHVCRASHDVAAEQEALLALAAQLAALVEAYDRAARDQQAMEAAAENFSSLLQVGLSIA